MKTLKPFLPYLLCIILGLLLARECNRDKSNTRVITITRTIDIPPIKGWFPPVTEFKDVVVREVDSTYKDAYLATNDSLERLKMYLDAITIREYSQTFEDSVQKVDIWSKVRGELLAQSLDYHIFERTVTQTDTIELEGERNFYLLPTVSSDLSGFRAGVGILYQDRAKRLYTLSYDTEQYLTLGVGIKF